MFERDFIVEYVDIDSNNQMSDYGFFKHLQEIGCLHASHCGYGLNDVEKTRVAWIILDWKLKVFSRPSWNAKIHIKTWPSQIDMVSCFRDYVVLDENGNKLAIATSRWILLNVDTHRISKITPDVIDAFSPILPSVFDTEIEKLKEPDSYESVFEYTILKRDIDTNHHLNNLNYIILAKEAIPENMNFSGVEVMYKHQCVLGDTVLFKYHKINENEHIVAVKSMDEKTLHAIIRLKS